MKFIKGLMQDGLLSLFVTIISLFVALVFFAVISQNKTIKKCRENGGVYVARISACVRSGAFIDTN